MAELFPDTGLFDELEFLRFSDEQFASEVVLPEASDAQQSTLFTAAPLELDGTDSEDLDGSPMSRTLTELKTVVASHTVGIYHSPEPDVSIDGPKKCKEKTLNEMVVVANDRDALKRKLSWSQSDITAEEADVTSPVSFSAVNEMPSMEGTSELVQSSEVSQTASPASGTSSGEQPKQRRLKMCRKPGGFQSQVRTYSKHDLQAVKRKHSVIGEDAEMKKFKTSKRTKKYLERPFTDPDMERTRLNAINAKKNRDKKKQEMQALSEQCDDLCRENEELDRANRNLETRLNAAEEEIAFLRRALLGQMGSAKPSLGDALKSLTGGDSAPAGVCGVGGTNI